MTQTVSWQRDLPRNSGYAFPLKKGQSLRLTAQSIIDFVVFNHDNLRERFDQARTKSNQRKIFLSTGDQLISKLNNTMMTIVEDMYSGIGHHDLQEGTCSRKRFELVAQRGMWELTYKNTEPMPERGCFENIIAALKPYPIEPEDIPSPFNIFQHMEIDGTTGAMLHTKVRPPAGTYVTLRAEMDLLAALSVCPDPVVPTKTGATLVVLEP